MTIPTTCPACGAYSLTAADETSRLLLVCDVLVVKALERVGNRVLRSQRSRFCELGRRGLPVHEAHTLWPTDQVMTTKALAVAWDVIGALLSSHDAMVVGVDPAAVTSAVDRYVRALVASGRRHEVGALAAALSDSLGLRLPLTVTR